MNPPDAPAPHSASNRWKAVLLLLLIFALGVATGGGGALLYVRAQFRQALTRPLMDRDRVDRLAGRIEANLTDSLKLDARERAAVHEELAVSTRRAKLLRLRMLFETRLLIGDTLTRIGNRLPDDKRVLLKEKAATRLNRWGLNPDALKEKE